MSIDLVMAEVFTIIETAIAGQPRTLQTRIGPSELGTPCDRRLGHKLAGTPPVNTKQDVPWKAWVGTAIHEQIGNAIARHEVNRYETDTSGGGVRPRWHVEERVTVGDINGVDITGQCDLFDETTGTVIDFKTTTANQIRENYKPHGPGPQYRAQAHLYGRGWQLQGHRVNTVAIAWLLREGEFHQRHVWSEPYDEQVAIDAIARAAAIDMSLASLGPDFTLPLLQPTAAYCRHCDWFKKNTTDLSRACPGVAATAARTTTPFDDLLPKEHVNA
jgi:hypothetical protein